MNCLDEVQKDLDRVAVSCSLWLFLFFLLIVSLILYAKRPEANNKSPNSLNSGFNSLSYPKLL